MGRTCIIIWAVAIAETDPRNCLHTRRLFQVWPVESWDLHPGNLECSSFLTSSGRSVFVCSNVAFRPLWSFDSTLVGADPVDKTGGKRNLVESWTPWCQCVGPGRAAVVLQPHRASKQFGKVIHCQDLIGALLRPGGWIEGGTRAVLEQVIPIRCQPPCYI